MDRFAFLISSWSLTGRRPAFTKLQEILKRYRLLSVLHGLSRISVKLRSWENSPTRETDQALVQAIFPGSVVRQIETQRSRDAAALVFHRVTILFLIKQAFLNCPSDGIDINRPEDLFSFSQCFLFANDLLLGYEPSFRDTIEQLLAGLMPFYDLIPQESFPEDLIRNIILFEAILPQLMADERYVDFPAEFEARVGMPYRRFCLIALALTAKPMLAEQSGQLLTNDFIIPATYFGKTRFSPQDVASFLSLVSSTEDDFRSNMRKTKSATDVMAVQRCPLLRLADGRRLALDTTFLLDKASAGVFWSLRELMDDRKATKAFEFWGILVERYAHWLWRESYQGAGTYFPNVRFENADEAFDAVAVEKGTLIVLEYKSGMLPVGAKHSFDDQELLEAIDRKYVRSEKGQKKGVGQLQNSLTRFLRGEVLVEAGVTRDKIHTIHSLIVSADPALTSPLIAIYLDKKLDRSLIRLLCKRMALAPLQLATFVDLERLLPYTKTIRFEVMIEAANKSNLKGGNFRQRAREAIKSGTPGKDFVKDRWKSLADELCGYLP